jgi:hypothetical protein
MELIGSNNSNEVEDESKLIHPDNLFGSDDSDSSDGFED